MVTLCYALSNAKRQTSGAYLVHWCLVTQGTADADSLRKIVSHRTPQCKKAPHDMGCLIFIKWDGYHLYGAAINSLPRSFMTALTSGDLSKCVYREIMEAVR